MMSKRDKDKWFLIIYKFNGNLSHIERNKIIRKIYGYKDHSNYNKYQYVREGILSNITYFSPIRSIIITQEEYLQRIFSLLKGKASIYTFELKLTQSQMKKLKKFKKGV